MKAYFVRVAVALVFAFLTSAYLLTRFSIGIDSQKFKCLPVTVFLIDHWDTNVARGDLAYVDFPIDSGPIKRGTKLVKLVAGEPNEAVLYSAREVSISNGPIFKSDISRGVAELGMSIPENGRYELDSEQYFMIGTLPMSFDSRYFGGVRQKHIKGTAYAIF